MNCKQGDMAMYVKSLTGNEGKIVTCLRLATSAEIKAARFTICPIVWVIDRWVPSKLGFPVNLAYDSWLIPIRPGDLHETEDDHKEVTA